MRKTLAAGLPLLGLSLDETTQNALCAFGEAVIEQNKVMNLTAITEPTQVAKLHLLDSLSLLTLEDLKGKRMIDVGCGAGFPSLVLAILRPDLSITALDSTDKKVRFVKECAELLPLPNLPLNYW